MSFFSKLFSSYRSQPEDLYVVTITDDLVSIDHPKKWSTGSVRWNEIEKISLVNTDRGPWQPDVWLTLIGPNDRCMIPQGAKGFEEVYEVVSKFEGFDHQSVVRSMSCTDNAKFLLWTKK